MVLKVTPPGEDRQLMVRACREVLFYQDLATHVPVLVPRVLGLDFNETEGAVLLLGAYLPSPSLDPQMTTMPATLCHGDCHAGNLLLDRAGQWLWADWQEVRLGPGVDDLAFFWQRSFVAADMTPPYDAMVQAYVVGLETGGEVQITREQLDRELWWAELRSWLVDWPSYLGALSGAQMERVLQRIEMLIRHFADP